MLTSLDIETIRKDFPILKQKVHGKPLVYLDNAATTQKPQAVLDSLINYYSSYNANIHRGVHQLSEQATLAYETTRQEIKRFINASGEKEIIFVRGTTEGINLVANSYGRRFIEAGDEIIISTMEHHSNIVPWQMLCQEKGAILRVIPINDSGELLMGAYEKLLGPRTKFVAITHVSNALGTINPVKQIVEMAHKRGAVTLVDGAQAVAHRQIDVQDIGCDFYAFSGHKLYGPTGIGVLYGKAELLEEMPPYQGGGDMIKSVTLEKTIYNDLPYKFEAGTPNIADTIALGAAIRYVSSIGFDQISTHEHDLLAYGTDLLSKINGIRIIGTAEEKSGVISFTFNKVHAHDVGTILDREGIAIRTGHHCAQPVMQRFGVPATARASFAVYNTRSEIDSLVKAIGKVAEVFS